MFKIGERIIYGSEGVFEITEYASSPIDKSDDRVFYILKPVYGPQGNIIFTPADNDKTVMRQIMSQSEAKILIEKMISILPLDVEREKNRRDLYKFCMISTEPENYVRLIKTVYLRREEFAKQKRRLSDADTDYEKKAKFCLYGELSIALDMPFEKVEEYISNKLFK